MYIIQNIQVLNVNVVQIPYRNLTTTAMITHKTRRATQIPTAIGQTGLAERKDELNKTNQALILVQM